ncbi:MAG TPA: adenylosuccinate lyase [Firmicutes bacterium]|nr:adenylosuccinate lyase [Bacillota bacterium]
MIERYTLPEMRRIWSDENRFSKWLEIEILACEAWAELGRIPKDVPPRIRQRARFDVKRIEEIEKVTNHDVIAFLTCIAENVGEDSRFIHLGMTSSDVVDTALSLMMREACDVIIQDVKDLLSVLCEKANTYRHTVMIGRTHGIHAEPITFGFKLAVWVSEMRRNLARLEKARDAINVGKISGAVGTYANVDPYVEEYVCKKLGLTPAPVSTQILQRDRHAEFVTALAIVAGSLEKFATEIRALQRTEISEAREPFRRGQKGSSAMPHKRNPILCERISGLARLVRGYAASALEDMALWHERDISHSSVERVILPDSTTIIDYMLRRFTGIMKDLTVDEERMKENLMLTRGVIFSERVLLGLVQKGLVREDAYAIVQRNALRALDEHRPFKDLLMEDPDVMGRLTREELDGLFSYEDMLCRVDEIMRRLGL